MESRYHQHHGHNIPHRGGEGVLNTANSKTNDRTLIQFMSLSPSILGVCRRSKYARWSDTIDEDDPWIWGLDSMFKASTAPDYIYPTAAMVRNSNRWLAFFSFQHNYLSVSVKKGIFFFCPISTTQNWNVPTHINSFVAVSLHNCAILSRWFVFFLSMPV